ncbi:hypothetical protein BVRB_5g113500 isoform A [Beta vulgaris subsp. vulgaris]|uniref:UspA domain-containing protein n=1 Tax=Beta vulgaris subsp. vulgaris TaxID=3555 RepID=A0A0J8F4T2_BETVV|nr:uncharacterized protein LOC104893927 isoform X2 [Beta vulgaris subsp. vulgaris]KMT10846.1 hypothetical protein BVRB_5g113500 isoform A [Beta vulgaris subsp. vulgaris]
MVRVHTKNSASCFRISKARIRVRSPPLQSNPAYNSIKAGHKNHQYFENDCGSSFNSDTNGSSEENSENGEPKEGNRIMVVVDASQEANGALHWALSHTVQKEDTVILLHITKPSKNGSHSEGDIDPKAYGLPYSLKSVCQSKRPGVQVEVLALEGKAKGPIIVDQAKEQKASLLVLGHRRRSKAWRFWMRWAGRNRSSHSVVDYCIQNADCMTIAVRRKNKKLGGYLITTKRHKNFWLLA